MAIRSMKPITDVTLENGKINLFTKKFKYEKTTPERETKFQPHANKASLLRNEG